MRVDVLGPLRVDVDGTPVEIGSARARLLLAALALTPGESVPAEVLARSVWGDDETSRARARVHTLVARLRKVVGAVVCTTADGYLLAAAPDAVDVSRFLHLLDTAARAGDPAGELAALRGALALWRGEPVCVDRVHGLVERYLGALCRRADLGLAERELDGLAAELAEAVAAYPLHEPLWERYIRVLATTKRTAEALAAYASCRAVLGDELGVEPNAALRQLHLELLEDGGPPAAEPPDRPRPRQLPGSAPWFVGRAAELWFLDEVSHSDPEHAATVVVHGVGGVGKTALAVRWAHQVADRYPDGQLYVDLRGYGPGRPVEVAAALSNLLYTLGVPDRALPSTVAEHSALLRTVLAGQRVLMVLDNAKDVAQVRPLLPGPGCMVIVTSRSVLRGLVVRDGARSLHLRGMSDTEAAEVLARGASGARIANEASAAAELATLCGHLPLALRITADLASRHPDTSLAELADELRAQRLETLADQADDAIDPRGVFSWSYRDLPPADARVFRLLSLLPGDRFGTDAAAALDGGPPLETRRVLDRLVGVHLLESIGPSRYRFHDLLRDYAGELTLACDPPEDRDAAVLGVLDWYTRTAMVASGTLAPGRQLWTTAPGPSPFHDQLHALDWFESERDACAAAVRLAASVGADDLAWRLAAAMLPYYATRPVRDEWEATFRLALGSADRLGDEMATAAILTGLATIRFHLGRDEEANRLYTRALTMFERAEVKAQQATVLVLMGNTLEYLGRHEEARRRYLESVTLAQDIGDEAREAHALNNLAITALSLGRHDDAVAYSERCLLLRRRTGDVRGSAHTLDNLGDAWFELGRYRLAAECYRQAVGIARTYRDRRNEVIHLANLARAESRAGRPALARAKAREAGAVLRGIPDSDAAKIMARLRAAFPGLDMTAK